MEAGEAATVTCDCRLDCTSPSRRISTAIVEYLENMWRVRASGALAGPTVRGRLSRTADVLDGAQGSRRAAAWNESSREPSEVFDLGTQRFGHGTKGHYRRRARLPVRRTSGSLRSQILVLPGDLQQRRPKAGRRAVRCRRVHDFPSLPGLIARTIGHRGGPATHPQNYLSRYVHPVADCVRVAAAGRVSRVEPARRSASRRTSRRSRTARGCRRGGARCVSTRRFR